MTIKVYDSKVYGKTVYMRYGMIEDDWGQVGNCNIEHLPSPTVPYLM